MAKSTKKKSPALRVGDLIKPIKGRRSSNYYTLRNIKKAKVNHIFYNYQGKKEMDITILEGSSLHDGYTTKTIGSMIRVYADAFELYQKVENYSIW